ncbi:hypothetical protein [Pseudomonas syringae]|uniref:hypothetical protein n=1 Tax=Pseudomonas syringae TaxID=317 RepID=UPI001110456E|nr:hypothetical protein [Pseudomonas syringae]
MFFGKGRKPLLDFLRNLTPKIILLGFALMLSSKLNIDKFDISIAGIKRTLPFAIFLFIFCAAFMANFTTFVEDSLESYKTENLLSIKDTTKKGGLNRIWKLTCNVWSYHRLQFLNMILVMLVAVSALSIVFAMGIQGALSSPFFNK